jgi:hypothetical protein
VRRGLVGIVAVCALALAPSAAWAQDEEDESGGAGSLAAQLLSAADESLGEDATIAVLRAYDRGYEALQIIEAMFDGLLAPDGTITDDDGAPVAPYLPPSGLIEDDGTSTGAIASGLSAGAGGGAEQIALEALATGIGETTKQIDKEVDLEARTERAGASSEDLFTMLSVLALAIKGYTAEQVILEGVMAEGIQLGAPGFDPVIVDARGKVVRPAGVPSSPDAEEQAGTLEQLESDIVDMVGGVDPRDAADESFKKLFNVKVAIVVSDETTEYTITAKGTIGKAKAKELDGAVVGEAAGHIDGGGTCSIGDFIDESVPYDVTGPVDLGLAGRSDGGTVSLKAGVVDAIIAVDVEENGTICSDLVQETTEPAVELLTVGPFDVKLKKGATSTATGSIFDATYEATITLS